MHAKTFEIVPFDRKYSAEVVGFWRESKERALGQPEKHSFENHIEFLENHLSPEYKVLVAVDPTNYGAVGMIAYNSEEVGQLYIHPNFQGMGIGTQLLNIAKEGSNGSLWLFTFEINVGAQKFYERHGFKVIGRGYENEETLPDIKYKWVRSESKISND